MRKIKRNSVAKSKILEFIEENSKNYILFIIIFFIGISIGIICINNSSEECKNEISLYINDFISTLKSNENMNVGIIILDLIKSDLVIALILFLLSSTVIGIPFIYLIIIYKGYSFGYTISSIFGTLGIGKGLILLIALILTYLIYIPSIISISISGINLYKKIISQRRETKLGICILKHLIFCIGMLILMCIASVIESYMIIWLRPIIMKNF